VGQVGKSGVSKWGKWAKWVKFLGQVGQVGQVLLFFSCFLLLFSGRDRVDNASPCGEDSTNVLELGTPWPVVVRPRYRPLVCSGAQLFA
jgi:hypothetical protein